MLCDICKKNEATIHIKEISSGGHKILNLCSVCAAGHEKTAGFQFGAFNLAEMLYNLGKLGNSIAGKMASDMESAANEPVCPECGWTTAKLRKSGGRLGCAKCYQTFKSLIEDALINVHRGTIHLGKRPDGQRNTDAVRRSELTALRKELDALIKQENYEQAAVVRDRIRELETVKAGE